MRSSILLMALALLGTAFGGFIDPDILRLLSSSQSNGYYVVSPSHLLPASVFKANFLPVQLASQLSKQEGYTDRDLDSSRQKLPKVEDDQSQTDSYRPAAMTYQAGSFRDEDDQSGRDPFSQDTYTLPIAQFETSNVESDRQRDSFSQDAFRQRMSSQLRPSSDEDDLQRNLFSQDTFRSTMSSQFQPFNDEGERQQSDSFFQDSRPTMSSRFEPTMRDDSGSQNSGYLPPKFEYRPPKAVSPKPEYGPPRQVYTPRPLTQHPWILKSYIEPTYSFGEIPLYGYAEAASEPPLLETATNQGYLTK